MRCSECHQTVVNTANGIVNKSLHVDGVKQVSLSGGGTYTASNKSCSGLGSGCHGTKSWGGN
jgi:hypothetical protein